MTADASNLEINRSVRRILVSKWIDLGRLSIHATRNSVIVRGTVQKLPGANAHITSEYMESIYTKLQSIPGVQIVNMQLDNWTRNNTTGTWIGAGDSDAAMQTKLREKDSGDGIYEIR